MSEKTMSVVDHLTELRTRIVVVLIGFVVTFVAGLFLAKPVILFLQHAEQAKNMDMNAFRVTDPLDVYMKFAFIIGIVLCSPVIMYQIWAFIRPGLLKHEQKVTLSYIPMTFFLFIFGLMFSYFIIFPNILGFMQDLGQSLNIDNVIGINEYFFLLNSNDFAVRFLVPNADSRYVLNEAWTDYALFSGEGKKICLLYFNCHCRYHYAA